MYLYMYMCTEHVLFCYQLYRRTSQCLCVLWAHLLPEAEAYGAGQDACQSQIKGTPWCAHSSAHGGAVPRGRASSRRDGEGLPHWVRGQHAPPGEADDLKWYIWGGYLANVDFWDALDGEWVYMISCVHKCTCTCRSRGNWGWGNGRQSLCGGHIPKLLIWE